MIKKLLVLLMVFAASVSYAESASDLAFQKKLQYLKLMTVQEIRILQHSLNCLNNAQDDIALKRCMAERQAMVQRLKQPVSRNNPNTRVK